MCTLTVLRTNETLTLTMNRDDAPARAEAPPRVWREGAPDFAAPIDLEAGGTWIGVNSAGVAACLLNRYDEAARGARSRGEIVPRALGGQDLTDAAAAVAAIAHSQYSPFTCLIVAEDGALRFDWNGDAIAEQLLCVQRPLMMTSSSWRFEAVAAWRGALFEDTLAATDAGPVALSDFHCALRPGEEAWAPMMRRDYAHTKSVTQIVIGKDDIELRYWPREQALQRGLSRSTHVMGLRRKVMA
ncbi:MAG TPA: hypothetical protein DHW63_12895 [Hyphomonadaceae bacterium]|nr:hypothetical protein [Hyphomonadaceae bacterium]